MRPISGPRVLRVGCALLALTLAPICARAETPLRPWAWGANSQGQLGDGTTTQRLTPVPVSGQVRLVALAGGQSFSAALAHDGTVWAWGRNAYGQLGDGTTTARHVPGEVVGLTDVAAIAAGESFTVALRDDGTVWAWGHGARGQLGRGTFQQSESPVQVSGLTNATAVAAGTSHALAARSDGTAWAWGMNEHNELGDGTTTDRTTPVQVTGVTNAEAVAGGDAHSLALLSDGTVCAWGCNGAGQLGDGTTTTRSTPVPVIGLAGVQAIAAGVQHSLALRNDGTLWAWGANSKGQLGDGSGTGQKTPVQVSGLANVEAIAAGYQFSVAWAADGTMWVWGSNLSGELGNGTKDSSPVPIPVATLINVRAIGAGRNHALAGTLVCPEPLDDAASVPEDSTANPIYVLENDSHPDGDDLTITSVTDPPNGTAAIDGTHVVYTPDPDVPNPDDTGQDTFQYTVTDEDGDTATATVTVTVTNVNDAPHAVADAPMVPLDSTSNSLAVLANDSDPDGDVLTVAGVADPPHGTASTDGTTVVYTPDPGYHGTDSFDYTAADGHGGTDSATITVLVNAPPDAADDTPTVAEDTAANPIDVLANDSDPNGHGLIITDVTDPPHGTATIDGDHILYTPAPDYPNPEDSGEDSFDYTVSDGHGGSDTATVTVTVTNVNDPPVAATDSLTVQRESTDNPVAVLANDTDPDGDAPLILDGIATPPGHGAAVVDGDQVLYTPEAGYHGSDSFTYTVSDGNGGTADGSVLVTVKGGWILEVQAPIGDGTTDPPTGSHLVHVDESADVEATAAAGWTFLCWLGGGVPSGHALDNPLTVPSGAADQTKAVQALFIHTEPQLFAGHYYQLVYRPAGLHWPDARLEAQQASYLGMTGHLVTTTSQDESDFVTANLLPPLATHSVVPTQTWLGGLQPPGSPEPNGGWTWVTGEAWGFTNWYPGEPNNGGDTHDEWALLTAPTISSQWNDGDGDYVPLHYYVVEYDAGYTPPDAADDTATVDEDSTDNAIDVLANDDDPAGGGLTITDVTDPPHGSATIDGDHILYTPDPDFPNPDATGEDTFQYTVEDAGGQYDLATVTVTILNVNDPPAAADDALSVIHDTADNPLDVLGNDTDPENDALSVGAIVDPPSHGTATAAGDHVSYTPDPGYVGMDSFTYTASDGAAESGAATVTVIVTHPAPGLVAHWRLDETEGQTAYDCSGNDHHGTLVNGPVWTEGIEDGALQFDGSNDRVGLPQPAANGLTDFTVSFYARTSASRFQCAISGQGPTGDDEQIVIAVLSPTALRVAINSSSLEWTIPDVIDGSWHHIAVTRDAAAAHAVAYVDGLSVGTVVCATAPLNIASNGLMLGQEQDVAGGDLDPAQSWAGTLDDVRIYDRVLTPAEIQAIIGPQPPFAMDDAYRTQVNGTLEVDVPGGVLANDSDMNGDPLTAVPGDAPANGALTLNADGSFTYTPNPGFAGVDTFTYKANDGSEDSAEAATVTIVVASDVAAGLVAHWKFDEGAGTTAHDSSPNANHGTLTNGPTWAEGVWGRALSFDGDDDYVDCGSTPSLNSMTTQMTACCWIRTTDDGVSILGKRNDAGTGDFHCAIGSGHKLAFSGNGGAVGKVDGEEPPYVQDGVWHHVAWVLDTTAADAGERLKMYVDGARHTNFSTYTAPPLDASLTLRDTVKLAIGSIEINHGGINHFGGLIDDVRIYDRALTQEEIWAVANFDPIFLDVTAEQFPESGRGLGTTFADVDNDGDWDNVCTEGNRVFVNDGSGAFALAPDYGGLGNTEGHSAIPGDYDNDGHIDIAIGWYWSGGSRLYHNDGDGTFTEVSSSSGVGNPGQIHGGAFVDVDLDGDLDLSFARDGSNLLYINDGTGHFTNQASSRGADLGGYGIATMFADFDGDGDPDLLATTSTSTASNVLRLNNGSGYFTDVTSGAGLSGIGHEGPALGDIDNDGDLDIFFAQDGLFINDGAGHFTNIGSTCGISAGNVMAPAWGDVDNDGDLDLVSDGKLWLNNGDLTFTDATVGSGIAAASGNPSALGFADVDADGDLDLRCCSGSAYAFLKNLTNNGNYLIVLPVRQSGTPALNAKVWVYRAGHLGEPAHLLGYREVYGATTRTSGSPLYAHFGLPDDAAVDVRVWFLSHTKVDLPAVARGQTITVVEPDRVPGVMYVDRDATGANDGTSWEDAYVDLQDALAAAWRGDQIWVAEGTYKPTSGTDRSIAFVLKPQCAVYGGFAGVETAVDQRNWLAHPTILSGGIGAQDESADNSYHVLIGADEAALDGFTVTGGNAYDATGDERNGGGLRSIGGSLTLGNCVFIANAAYLGGGLYCDSGTHTLANCRFQGNTAREGAGMRALNASLILTACEFDGNIAEELGGGLWNYRCSGSITDCTFTGNETGEDGAAIYSYEECSPAIEHCRFSGNSAFKGAAIYNYWESSPTIVHCLFTGNASALGGAIYNSWEGSPLIVNCTFAANTATIMSGAIHNFDRSEPTVRNCILWGNTVEGEENQFDTFDGCYPTVTYSCVGGGYAGTGNIDTNPLFVDADAGDFHLKSATGHWTPGGWVIDAQHSPCIDAGYPDDPVGDELIPNGGLINMGAYGGTEQASKSAPLWTLDVLAPDPAEGGTTSPGPGQYSHAVGLGATITASPVEGWKVGHWEVDGVPAGTGDQITVSSTVESEVKTVQVVFVRQTWTLELLEPDPPEGGTTTPGPGSYTYNIGSTPVVMANPNTAVGWSLDHWQLDGADAGSENPITVPSAADGETVTLQPVFVHDGRRVFTAGHTSGTIGTTVEVPISIDDGTDVISIDMTITWDAGMLDFVQALKGAITGDWTLTTSPAAGSVVVSLFHSAALPAEGGEVARLRFQIIGGHTVSPVAFASISVNEGAVPASGIDGSVTVTGFTLGGTVAYFGGAQAGVPDVTMTLSDGYSDVVTTDASGDYAFLTVPPEDVTCTPSRQPDPENPPRGLSSYDAAKVAQAVVGVITPSPYEHTAGDVTGNGSLSSFDAARIAQRVVGLIDDFQVPDFLFEPEDRSYEPMDADQSGQDFVMIRAGDYSGSWTPPDGGGGTSTTGGSPPSAARARADAAITAEGRGRPPCLPSSPTWAGAGARPYILGMAVRGGAAAAGTTPLLARTVSIPTDLTVEPGGTVQAPVSIDDATDIIGYDFVVTYDPLVVHPLAVTKTAFTDAFTLTPRIIEAESKVIVSLFSTQSLTGGGVLVNIEFEAIGSAGEDSPLVLGNVFLNEGEVPATPTNGLVAIADPTVVHAVDDTATVDEDSADNAIHVLANDTDPAGGGLSITSVTDPPHGTATINGDHILYTPDPDFPNPEETGADTFQYTVEDIHSESDTATVTVTVTNVNDPPSATNDDAIVVQDTADNALTVLNNDTDPDNDALTVHAIVDPPSHGTAVAAGDHAEYTPESGYSGPDSFTYTATDGTGVSNIATVSVVVASAGSIFIDVSATCLPADGLGCGSSFVDVDRDGDWDIVAAGPNQVFLNDGAGTFSAAPGNAGLDYEYGVCVIPADLDADGHTDVAIGGGYESREDVKLFLNNGDGSFTEEGQQRGMFNTRLTDCGAFADIDHDVDLDFMLGRDVGTRLYVNDGLGYFTADSYPGRGTDVPGPITSIPFTDIDGDGDPDLLVSVFNRTPTLLLNDGRGYFTDATADAGLTGKDWGATPLGDIDNDGDLDVFRAGAGVFINDGAGHFTDITATCGIAVGYLYAAMWADVNNDGHLDLVGANRLWLSNGDLTFTDATADSGIAVMGESPRCVVLADVDADGDLDVRSCSPTDSVLLRNRTDNDNYLIVLPQRPCGSPALNAKVWVYRSGHLGDPSHLLGYREILGATIVSSGCPLFAHFGLPDDATVDVRVWFPVPGMAEDVPGVPRGQSITVVEPEPDPQIIYVDLDATGANNGTSWEHAFTDLHDALAIAEPTDQIWVAEGTYKPTSGTDRWIAFVLKPQCAVYGGFAGVETAVDQRNWLAHPTILSGDIGAQDESADNSHHVLIGAADAVLDGFTVTGGNAYDATGDERNGGGLRSIGGSLTLGNCVFIANAAYLGGGLYCDYGTHTVANCRFQGNTAREGAGMRALNASLTITACEFDGNTAEELGGGLWNYRCSGTITHCTFTGNETGEDGAGIYSYSYDACSPAIEHCRFSGNSAFKGAAIYNYWESSPTIVHCLFTGNAAALGGAIYNNWEGSPLIVNCTFAGNTATIMSGAIHNFDRSEPTVRNCILWGNTVEGEENQFDTFDGCYPTVTYSCVGGGYAGTGNIDAAPLFVDADAGDFHLKSATGHWTPGGWVIDAQHSPCIDAGYPDDPVGDEPIPNGGLINMGAYGGTEQASKSSPLWTLDVLAPDPAEGGTTSPGPGQYTHAVGLGVTVTASPAEGWKVGHWEVDGVPAGTGDQITVSSTVESEVKTVQIVFVHQTWTLELLEPDPPEGGTTTPGPGSYTYNIGSTPVVMANPNSAVGWSLDHWQLDGADAGSENPITVPSAADGETVTLQAVFLHYGPRFLAAGHTSGTIGSTVEVPISIDDGTDVVSIDLTITWDVGMLDFVEALKGAITGDWTLTTSPAVGSVAVSLSHSAALPPEGGELARLRFQIIGGHTVSPVAFAGISLNEGAVTASGIDGSVTVTGFTLGGTVAYFGGAQAGVPDVTMTVSGDYSDVVATDAAGDYTFLTVPPEDITCTPSRASENPPGGLSSYDAAKVAQAALGMITPSAHEETAGDVLGTGTLSEEDAEGIAQRVVGLTATFPVPDFLFVPEGRSYEPLDADLVDQDFVMVRAGDYTGNWTPPDGGAGTSTTGGTNPLLARMVRIVGRTVAPGGTVQVPVSIDNAADIIGYDFEVTYNPLIVRPVAVTKTEFTDGFTLTPHIIEAEAKVLISLFNTEPLAGAGELVNIEFEAVGSTGDHGFLGFEMALLNEGEVPATALNGGVHITGSLPVACVDDSNTTGIEDGSEAHPFDTIQEGVDAVAAGATVKVAQGTYTSLSTSVVSLYSTRLPAVFLRGGYVGSSDYLSGPGNFADGSRDWEINVTTIDGENARRCVHFAIPEGELSGFHLTRGSMQSSGGGIYLYGRSVVISDNVISDCVAQWSGGGIQGGAHDQGVQDVITIARNTIMGNSSLRDRGGGGICCVNIRNLTISNNTVKDNWAQTRGGGIAWDYNSGTVSNNLISGNSAGGTGGGVCCDYDATLNLRRNTIAGNSAELGGGVCVDHDSVVAVENNLVVGNTATVDGGAVFIDASPATTVVNNTIVGNSAPTTGGIAGSSNTAVNCILWGNTGGDLAACTATYSCIEDGDAGTGNISATPRFVGMNEGRGRDNIAGTDDDNYRLAANSPCIDVGGWRAAVPETDRDGNPRYDDLAMPNGPDAGTPPKDIGAYERQELSLPIAALTATVQLEGYTGSPGAILTLRFILSDADEVLLDIREVDVAFTNGSDTETVVLTDVPPDTAWVSCKEIGHFLRRRVAAGGAAPALTADFTGANQLLGGDLNDDNFVELRDFAQFLRDFGKPDCPESDINGDGDVDNTEFGYIGLHFFQTGDPE